MVASIISRSGWAPCSLSWSRWARNCCTLSFWVGSSASFSSALLGAIFSGSIWARIQASMPWFLMSAITVGVGPKVVRRARCRIGSLASTVFTVTWVAAAAAAGPEKLRPPAGAFFFSASPAREPM